MASVQVRPVVVRSRLIRSDWCMRPYPRHPRGCPNFGKKDGCPPDMPLLAEALDCQEPAWAIYNVFPIGEHAARMRAKHPEWSDAQVYCCLYWQPRARKQLRAHIKEFMQQHRGLRLIGNPEAHGVNLAETMANAGIDLEWPPRKVAYQISLAGTPRKGGK